MSGQQRSRQREFGVLGAALTLAWLLVLAGVGTHTATVRAAQADGSRELFAEMMPAFTSPRCLGCHGLVSPSQGTNHEPGKVDVAFDENGNMAKGTKEEKACLECHTAANQWRIAPTALSFVGKDASALCAQIKRLNNLSSTNTAAQRAFLSHLSGDYFIGLAFVGKRAIGDGSAFGPRPSNPPEMSRQELVAAGRRWVQEGRASCGSLWNGTISKETTWELNEITKDGTVRTHANRSLEVTFTVKDGSATALVNYSSNSEIDDPRPPPKGGCTYRQIGEAAFNHNPMPATLHIDMMGADKAMLVVYVDKIEGVRWHVDKIFPLCKEVKGPEIPFTQPGNGTSAIGPMDPKDPKHFAGQKPIDETDGSKTIIKWDLTLTEG